MYYQSVLLHESIQGLRINPEGIYVDATFGGGGHSKAILSSLTNGKLLAFDQDQDAERNVFMDERFSFLHYNFSYLKNILQFHQLIPVDGILADLGVSSHQFDEADKGFSFRFDSQLDMRMDKNNPFDAMQLVNEYSEAELFRIFLDYGELKQAKRIAASIISYRNNKPIQTTFELKEAVKQCLSATRENKMLAQIFQAIRMEVNSEIKVLEKFLQQSIQVLKPGGRMVVIAYHSLEDRLVKNYLRAGNAKGEIQKDFYGNNISPIKPVGKLIVPSEEEISKNSRARSARMRIGEKK